MEGFWQTFVALQCCATSARSALTFCLMAGYLKFRPFQLNRGWHQYAGHTSVLNVAIVNGVTLLLLRDDRHTDFQVALHTFHPLFGSGFSIVRLLRQLGSFCQMPSRSESTVSGCAAGGNVVCCDGERDPLAVILVPSFGPDLTKIKVERACVTQTPRVSSWQLRRNNCVATKLRCAKIACRRRLRTKGGTATAPMISSRASSESMHCRESCVGQKTGRDTRAQEQKTGA